MGSQVGVGRVEAWRAQVERCARRSTGERKMCGQWEQQRSQPMAWRVEDGRDVSRSRWRWRPWDCAMAMPAGS